jgi:hypothetical protein
VARGKGACVSVCMCRAFIFQGHRSKPLTALNRRAPKGRLSGPNPRSVAMEGPTRMALEMAVDSEWPWTPSGSGLLDGVANSHRN